MQMYAINGYVQKFDYEYGPQESFGTEAPWLGLLQQTPESHKDKRHWWDQGKRCEALQALICQ